MVCEMNEKQLDEALNELIEIAANNGGHLYIVDKKHNAFALKLTEPIKIKFYAGYKGDTNESKISQQKDHTERDHL